MPAIFTDPLDLYPEHVFLPFAVRNPPACRYFRCVINFFSTVFLTKSAASEGTGVERAEEIGEHTEDTKGSRMQAHSEEGSLTGREVVSEEHHIL